MSDEIEKTRDGDTVNRSLEAIAAACPEINRATCNTCPMTKYGQTVGGLHHCFDCQHKTVCPVCFTISDRDPDEGMVAERCGDCGYKSRHGNDGPLSSDDQALMEDQLDDRLGYVKGDSLGGPESFGDDEPYDDDLPDPPPEDSHPPAA